MGPLALSYSDPVISQTQEFFYFLPSGMPDFALKGYFPPVEERQQVQGRI